MISANEVMLGDFLHLNIGESSVIGRVTSIKENRFQLTVGDGKVWSDKNSIEPIQLTEEMIRKVGFEKRYGKYYDLTKRFILMIEDNRLITDCGFYFREIKYVHELQHALRFCNEFELATKITTK